MPEDNKGLDFIRQRVQHDLKEGLVGAGVVTRFPPEPNGHLHIGHAKSINLNFGIAQETGGICYLRFDDTNPEKEDQSYVEAIMHDVHWLGFDWGEHLSYASDYFDKLHQFATLLIDQGKAYVCSLSADEMREYRGTLTEPGRNSPHRDRSIAENLDLFNRMAEGEFNEGSHVLRAKIDMASPNINLRDPVLYRIKKVSHQRTGDRWCIYPTYDFTHCICDALEGITHSLCTLEFEDHRPLYDWVLDNININFHPPQIEFSRLGLEYTVMSKRLLNQLVTQHYVTGWDDPRMPTIAGLRRRGVLAEAIRDFCGRIGVSKQDNLVELSLLDFCIRQSLESTSPRGMGVLNPLKVVITNFAESEPEMLSAAWHPQQNEMGQRNIPFSREILIEQEDFSLDPPPKYKRLSPGEIVRLRYAYIIRCDEVIQDAAGEVTELRCSYFPESRSGSDSSGLKPKGVIHWVSATQGVPVRVRLFDHLFKDPSPHPSNLADALNPTSLTELDAVVEPAVIEASTERFQFERQGYFFRDPEEFSASNPVFNRIVTLRDTKDKSVKVS